MKTNIVDCYEGTCSKCAGPTLVFVGRIIGPHGSGCYACGTTPEQLLKKVKQAELNAAAERQLELPLYLI